MFAIWRMVREEVDLRGAKNISKACASIMQKGSIVFTESGAMFDRVSAQANLDGELLRQRFYSADKARTNAGKYPILAARTEQYLNSLVQNLKREKHLSTVYQQMAKDGYARDGSTLPAQDKAALAFGDIYRPRSEKRHS